MKNFTTVFALDVLDNSMKVKPDVSQNAISFFNKNKNDMGTQSKAKKNPDFHYDRVTNKILEHLEQGTPPWRKTWGQYGLARNYATGHVYTGINMIWFNMIAPYDVPFYLTFKQAKELGGSIKKGSKAEYVYFYKSYFKDGTGASISADRAAVLRDKGEDVNHIRFLRQIPVFNISCLEGVEIEIPSMPTQENNPIEECWSIIEEMKEQPDIESYDGDRAFYNVTDDRIKIPHIKYFSKSEEYYCTLFHELCHWTGAESRLNRDGITDPKGGFGSKTYSEEEMIAEIGAAFLCAFTGIDRADVTENSASYIDGWKKRLKEDNKFIFRVAPKAQAAVNYILNNK